MATLNRLTDRKVKGFKPPKPSGTWRLADGGGLYFVFKRQRGTDFTGWSFIKQVRGKRPEIGLGSYPEVSLKAARDLRDQCNDALARNIDPREALNPADTHTTLREQFDEELEHRSASWKGGADSKTAIKWRATRDKHATRLMKRHPSSITPKDVADVLRPYWADRHPTAIKIQQHLKAAFDRAAFNKVTTDPNPARLRGNLLNILPRHDYKPEHHKGIDYQDAPKLAARLKSMSEEHLFGGVPAMLLLSLLVPGRVGEARLARVGEFNRSRGTWTVPPENEKLSSGKEMPIPPIVFDLLDLDRGSEELLFPGTRRNKPWSDTRPVAYLRNAFDHPDFAKIATDDLVVHGFRSTFKTWAQDKSPLPDVVSETVLGHVIGTKVRRVYARSEYFEQMREQLQAWADYLLPE